MKTAKLVKDLQRFKKTQEGIAYSLRLDVGDAIIKNLSGITQTALAKKIGVDRHYLNAVIHGRFNLTFSTVARIAKALGLKPRIVFDKVSTPREAR